MLEMTNIVKRFPGVLANDHINLSVRAGEIHGLLGENGAGKTTLMNILYGLYACDEGRILLEGREVSIRSPQEAITLGIGMVHQHFTLIPRMTVAQNIVLGVKSIPQFIPLEEVENEIAALAERQGIAVDPKAMVWQLAMGERQRVEILKALYRQARLLILDEPTSVVAPQEIAAFFQSLRTMASNGLTIIFITHKLDEVMSLTDRVTILRDGRVADVVNTCETSPQALAQKMVGREVVMRVSRPPAVRGETILDVVGLFALDDRGLPALQDVSFRVSGGEIVGVAGVSGNGQRELVEVLGGIRKAHGGRTMLLGRNVTSCSPHELVVLGVGLIPEDNRQEGLAAALPVRDNLILKRHLSPGALTRGPFLDDRAINTYCKRLIEDYGLKVPSVTVEAGKLSGGNLQRLILARELARDPVLLIANQPTRGLDVGATEYVYQRLFEARSAGRAVLLVSENLDEILTLSDRILVFFRGTIIGEVSGENADPDKIGLLMGGRVPEV